MSESLANRVGRIVSGGFNALVDAIENALPETVMEQALREVDKAIEEVRFELGRVLAAKHLASKRLDAERHKLESLTQQIETALKQQRDDLAEAAIAQQIDIEAQLPVLQATGVDAAGKEKQLQAYIQALQAKKREMQEELALFRRSQANQGLGDEHVGIQQGVVADIENASQAFQRAMNSASGLNAGAHGQDSEQLAKLAELEDLARKNRIQERLNKMKTRQRP